MTVTVKCVSDRSLPPVELEDDQTVLFGREQLGERADQTAVDFHQLVFHRFGDSLIIVNIGFIPVGVRDCTLINKGRLYTNLGNIGVVNRPRGLNWLDTGGSCLANEKTFFSIINREKNGLLKTIDFEIVSKESFEKKVSESDREESSDLVEKFLPKYRLRLSGLQGNPTNPFPDSKGKLNISRESFSVIKIPGFDWSIVPSLPQHHAVLQMINKSIILSKHNNEPALMVSNCKMINEGSDSERSHLPNFFAKDPIHQFKQLKRGASCLLEKDNMLCSLLSPSHVTNGIAYICYSVFTHSQLDSTITPNIKAIAKTIRETEDATITHFDPTVMIIVIAACVLLIAGITLAWYRKKVNHTN